jgi:broad specificity phosphatase PhoE
LPTLLLVRHGQASFGTADYDVLSDLGHRQAEVTAAAVATAGYRTTLVVSGSLRRQRDTALPFGEPAIDPRWDEYDAEDVIAHHSVSTARLVSTEDGEAEPIDTKSFQRALDPALDGWIAAGDGSPSNQSWGAFSQGAAGALAEVSGRLGPGETGVVATSGGVIAALASELLGAGPTAFVALNRVLVNGSITKLALGASGTSLISFNDHSHLEAVDRALVTYR